MRSNRPKTSKTYRGQEDVIGNELQLLISEVLPVSQNLNYKIRRKLSDVLSIQQSHQNKSFLALGGLCEDNLCDTLQEMAPSNVKTVSQTSLLHIESDLDHLGLLSPTHGQCSHQQSGKITVLVDKPKFLKATRHVEIWKIEIPRSIVVEALRW